jgi:hypothetical protein
MGDVDLSRRLLKVRQERRVEREREFGRSVPSGKYGVVIAGVNHADRIETHSAKHCVLLLSSGGGNLFDAINVISTCGFRYKTSLCQELGRDSGSDDWIVFRHHLWLIATKGIVPAPAMGTQWPSLIQHPGADMPEMFAAEFFPSVPVIDLWEQEGA